MSALTMLARSTIRGRGAALGWLAVLVALGIGTGIASLSAAWRTDNAYPRYLREAEVSDVVVNPSLLTDRAAELITTAPGVLDFTSDSLYGATLDTGAPRTVHEVDQDGGGVQIRASTDGRYVGRDRPVVHEGRMIDSGPEAFVNLGAAEAFGISVGDQLPIAFWDAGATEGELAGPTELIEPVGRAEVEVVGIGVLPDEVLADELYPRQRILVTPEVAAPYTCTPPHPPSDSSLTLEQLAVQHYPPGCSVTYRYFSLRVDGGEAGVAGMVSSLVSRLSAETARLPEALLTEDARFYLIPAVTAEERDRIERSLDPSVTALQLFGVAAAGSTLALAVLAVIRLARRSQPDARVWCQLGAARSQRAGAIGLPLGGALLVGIGGAVVVGWLASGIGPVASARALDPSPGLALPLSVVLPVLFGSVLVLGLGVAAASVTAARVTVPPSRVRASQVADNAARTGNVPLALGVRAAVRGGGATALLAAAVAAVIAVLGSVIFSTNLSDVVANPTRFAWPYDAAAITGDGYGDANEEAIARTLDRPEVESWGIAALGAATIGGEALPFVAGRAGFDDLQLPVVEGAVPVGEDQIALGARSADRLGLTVGDTVTVSTAYGEHTGTVSGLVVLPPVGPYLTDRAGLGTGVLLPAPFLERIVSADANESGVPAGELAGQLGSFVAIDLADGVDPDRFMASIGDDLPGWDAFGNQPYVHTEPVRPAQIADVAAMRSAPVLLATLVAVAMGIGLALAVGVSVRTRRRELALLRALGATGSQLRATLRWQAVTIIGTGLALGVPLGLALGRTTWRGFADGLGIAPAPIVSVPWIIVIVVAAVAVGLLASAVPGRIASRISPSAALRSE